MTSGGHITQALMSAVLRSAARTVGAKVLIGEQGALPRNIALRARLIGRRLAKDTHNGRSMTTMRRSLQHRRQRQQRQVQHCQPFPTRLQQQPRQLLNHLYQRPLQHVWQGVEHSHVHRASSCGPMLQTSFAAAQPAQLWMTWRRAAKQQVLQLP